MKVYAYPAVDRAEISRWWRPPCEGGVLLTNFVRSEVGTRCWRVEMGRILLCFELGFEYSSYNDSLVFTHRFTINEPVAIGFSIEMEDWSASPPGAEYLSIYQCDESRLRYRAEYSEESG